MSNLEEYVQSAQLQAEIYVRCTPEQALTYACEDIVERQLGTRTMESRNTVAWVEQVCQREDLDTPHIIVGRSTKSTLASASLDENAICIRGKNTTTATLLHEIAHISVGIDGHGVLFRDELVRLTRAHISVECAALLHALYTGVGLAMSPWPASASRR